MDRISRTEDLARYIYHRSQYRSSGHTVKYTAFIPPHDGCLSVFCISGLSQEEIWSIGENLRQRQLYGRADVKADSVYAIGLAIKVDNQPARHANIVDWPEDDSAIKLKAIELAESAQLHLK